MRFLQIARKTAQNNFSFSEMPLKACFRLSLIKLAVLTPIEIKNQLGLVGLEDRHGPSKDRPPRQVINNPPHDPIKICYARSRPYGLFGLEWRQLDEFTGKFTIERIPSTSPR